jgi:hypothetical protein
MVDVVEAMMISGPALFDAATSTSRLRSTISGTPSNTMLAPATAAAMSGDGVTLTRAMTASASFSVSKPKRARLFSAFATSSRASASSVANWSAGRALTSIMVTAWPA